MKQQKTWMAKVGEYSALAFLLPCTTAVGYLVGRYIDQTFGTTYWYLVFLLLGIVAGFLKLVQQLQKDTRDGGS
jgi:F0F1-type ATP synthase assembly protein I